VQRAATDNRVAGAIDALAAAKTRCMVTGFMRKNDFDTQKQPSDAHLRASSFEADLALRTSPGQVRHDGRGTAVWKWDVSTGVLAGSKAAELLQMLDNPMLEIADGDRTVGWIGDPYNRG
jgi:hypothetical protein